jgi:hypothetical protein
MWRLLIQLDLIATGNRNIMFTPAKQPFAALRKISKEGSQPTLGMSAVSTYFYITLRPLHDIQT